MGKKIGYFFYSITPAMVSLLLQIVIATIVTMIFMAGKMAGVTDATPDVIQQLSMEAAGESAAISVFAYHIIGIIVFGLWYYFGCGRPKATAVKKLLNFKFWGSAILAAIIFITMNYMVVYSIRQFSPQTIEAYNEMMEAIVMGNSTLLFIATVVLAPIGEELLMRGLTLHIALKCTKHFWIANMIQAFLFGFIHFNWVQGIYAFIGGLLLGWLYKKYNSLFIAIFVHFLVNLSAVSWADPVFSLVPDHAIAWILIGVVTAACFLGLVAWNGGLKKDKIGDGEHTF